MFRNMTGLFGGGNMMTGAKREGVSRTQAILGTLGDMFSVAGGGQASFIPGLQQRAMLEEQRGMQMQQAKQERDNAMQDWIARQQWERANPEPRAPDAFDIALQRGGIDPNSPEGQQMYRDRAASMARDPNDQFVTVTIPGVGTYAGPQSGLPSFAGTAPQRPVGRLTPIAPHMGAQQPQMTVTPRELDALVRRFGPAEVQARIDSGIVAVRNN